MAFEKYWSDKQKYDSDHKVETVKIDPCNSATLNKSVFLKSISDVDNMDDNQLLVFINLNFNAILNNVFNGTKTNEYVSCFTNVRFLDTFISVLQSKKIYDNNIIIACNNICYDYITLNSSSKDQSIVNRMIMIGNIINRASIPRLLGIGLNNNLASIILIARYSSFNIEACIKRVNTIIINQPKELMTYDTIHKIFEVIYYGCEIWITIFQYFMFDAIPEYNSDDEYKMQSVDEVNSTINLVILDILNNMPSQVIRGALINYTEDYNIINNGKPIRFSLKTISDDYYRVLHMVYHLINNEGFIIQ